MGLAHLRSLREVQFDAALSDFAGAQARVDDLTAQTRADLAAILDQPAPGTHVYTCGSAPFMAAVTEACTAGRTKKEPWRNCWAPGQSPTAPRTC